MTKTATSPRPAKEAIARCLWCRRKLDIASNVGRRREYCKQSCRQRAYESRIQSHSLGLSENELVITKNELEHLLDQVYVLSAAIEDVDRDLANNNSAAETRNALDWLLKAARPLVDTPLL